MKETVAFFCSLFITLRHLTTFMVSFNILIGMALLDARKSCMTRSLLSLIVRFVRLLPWCVHDVRCGGPFGEWRIAPFLVNEHSHRVNSYPGHGCVCGMGRIEPLLYLEIGAYYMYFSSHLAGSHICICTLLTTTFATFAYSRSSSHHPSRGSSPRRTTACLLLTDSFFHDSGPSHQSINISINQLSSLSSRAGPAQPCSFQEDLHTCYSGKCHVHHPVCPCVL